MSDDDNSQELRNTITDIINNAKIRIARIDLDKKEIEYSHKIKQSRKIRSIHGDEELVRAFLINRLVNDLDYRPDLIELEKEYSVGRPKTNKPRIDLILKDPKNNAFFFTEVKSPDKFESDKLLIKDQLFNLAKLETNVKYLVYYSISMVENQVMDRSIIIDYEKYNDYTVWKDAGYPSIGEELSPGYDKPKKPPLIKGDKKYDLKTSIKREEIQSLSTNLHNVLWGGGGTTDTEIFYSLVNIILAKIQDESEKENGEKYDFQIFKYGDSIESPEKVFDRINDLYRRALVEKLNVNEDRILDKAYVIHEEKFPLNKLVYTVQTLETFSFLEGRNSSDGKDILGDFFETITRDGFKQTKGQFFTPSTIVRFILYALNIEKLSLNILNKNRELPFIIDPSCGSGTFLIEVMRTITQELKYKKANISSSRQVQDRFNELFTPDNKENRWAREYIYGTEINFDLGTSAKVNMILHGDGSSNTFVKDGLLPFRFYDKDYAPNYLKIFEKDELYFEKDVNEKFDIIISNPPFSADLDDQTKNHLEDTFIFGGKKNSENLFIERWYQLLKPNGRLGVVLPESVFDTTENRYIRLFLFKYFKIKSIVSIPQLTFEPYTSTKTSLLFAQKKTKKEIEEWNQVWDKYGREWGKLRTKMKNYQNVYIKGKDRSKYPSIKDESELKSKENIFWFLKPNISTEDKNLDIKELLLKYQEEIEEFSKYDNGLKDIFGYYNLWWVFNEVSDKLDYSIFMAEAENVGYKRTKRTYREMPNDLYDEEIAPTIINLDDIMSNYNGKLSEKEKNRINTKEKLINLSHNQNSKTKKIKKLEDELNEINKEIESIENIKKIVKDIINNYYDEDGLIKDIYFDRTDLDLLNYFNEGILKNYRSNEVLIRKKEQIKILDFFRENVKWD